MSDLEELRQAIVKFTQERDWDQFHNGKDLALALSIEAAELNEAFLWKEASQVFGFELEQCCARGYEIDGIVSHYDINTAVIGKDIICTDSLPSGAVEDFKDLRITRSVMQKANPGAILDPCPPFYRGEVVSEDVISSEFFVGYEFKKCLLQVQQAIIIYCMLG